MRVSSPPRLLLNPTWGSGTTSHLAEHWEPHGIPTGTHRVPGVMPAIGSFPAGKHRSSIAMKVMDDWRNKLRGTQRS